MSDAPTAAEPMTLRAYAGRRGCALSAVQKAIKNGRLGKSLVPWGAGFRIGDPDMADREWEANSSHGHRRGDARGPVGVVPDPTPAPKPPRAEADNPPDDPDQQDRDDGPQTFMGKTQAVSLAQERYWKAQRAELDYKTRAGELVPVADVEGRWTKLVVEAKGRLLAVPSKAKQRIPALGAVDVAVIDALIREALEEMAAAPMTPPPQQVAAE